MAIPLPYAQSALSRGISDVSQEERDALQQARGSMQKPLDFDLEGAFVALSDKGFDERTATDTIAKKLSEKANFDVTGARKAGFTNEMIIAKLIGRDADDLESSKLYTFGQGVGRGAVSASLPGAAGVGTALALGVAGVAGAPVLFGGGLLAALAVGATGVGEYLEDLTFDERQLLPSERGYDTAGRVIGETATFSPLTKVASSAIKETVDFGSKKLLSTHQKNLKEKLDDAGKLSFGTGDKTAKIKRREYVEELVADMGRRSREQGIGAKGFSAAAAEELALTLIPAAFEGVADSLYPDDALMRTIGGLTGSIVPSPTAIVARGALGVAGVAKEDVAEKGFKGSALNLFGALDRTERVRQQKAAQYLAESYKKFGGNPVEFAAELDRLIAADPEFAKLVTAGQLSNDPFFLLNEATTRKGNDVLTNQQKAAGISAVTHIRGLVETLIAENSEKSLKAAAFLEKTGTEALLTGLLDIHLSKAALAAEKLVLREVGVVGKKTSVDIQAEQGDIIKNAALAAMADAKKIRKGLYDAVDQQVEVDTAPLLAAYRRLRSENLLTEADDLKGTFIKDLRNYGLDEPDGAVSDALKTLTSQQKTLTSRNRTLGKTFQDFANTRQGNDAFGEFTTLMKDENVGGDVDKLIDGIKNGELGIDLPSNLEKNVLKLATQTQTIQTNKLELQKVTDSLATVDLGRMVNDVPKMETIGELLAFRNKVRQQYRVAARGVVEGPTTAQLKVLDDGVTEAIGKRIKDGTASDGEVSDNIKALVAAENYALSYQEVFGRTFAGKLGRTGQAGAEVIDPESALEELFSGSAAKQTKKVKDLIAAMNFGEGNDEILGTVTGAMDVFLRNKLALEATATPVKNLITGNTETVLKIDPEKLKTFVDENQTLLNAMDPSGALLNDLSNVQTAQIQLESSLNQISEHAKNNRNEVSLAKFLEADSAETIISRVINSKTVVRDLEELSKRINAADTSDSQKNQFKEGMFSTLLASAITASTSNRAVDFKKLNGILFATGTTKDLTGFSQFPKGQDSLMAILQRNDGVPEGQAAALKDFLKRGEKLQDALEAGADDFLNAQETSAAKEFAARLFGAQGVSAGLQQIGISPTIQTTGAGASAAKNFFINLPQALIKDVLIDISKPGQAGSLANLMRKGASLEEQNKGANKILLRVGRNILGSPSYLGGLSVRGAEAAMEERPTLDEPPVAAVQPMAPPMPSPQMTARIAPPPAAPQPRPAAQPAPAGDQRSRYAAMFPNDPISSLITQQGIGSLPQAPG